MLSPLDRYLVEHSTAQGEALDWLEKQTNIRTNYPRMLSGAVQGRLLTMLVEMSGAHSAMEIGAFTGYSGTCIARGLPEDGRLASLEVNDELEDLMREGWQKSGVGSKIDLFIGDAKETLRKFAEEGRKFDFVFIDANKREYLDYYDLLFDMVVSGGVIVADDVLWDGKVYADPLPHDAQTRGLLAFNDRIASDPRVEAVILPLRDGITIIRKK